MAVWVGDRQESRTAARGDNPLEVLAVAQQEVARGAGVARDDSLSGRAACYKAVVYLGVAVDVMPSEEVRHASLVDCGRWEDGREEVLYKPGAVSEQPLQQEAATTQGVVLCASAVYETAEARSLTTRASAACHMAMAQQELHLVELRSVGSLEEHSEPGALVACSRQSPQEAPPLAHYSAQVDTNVVAVCCEQEQLAGSLAEEVLHELEGDEAEDFEAVANK